MNDIRSASARRRRGPLAAGDMVQLTSPKGRKSTFHLVAGKQFHTEKGFLNHDDLVGMDEGSVVTNSTGVDYQVLRPLLTDFVLSMPRGATVVYPKDAAQIVGQADIYPGAVVVEAGVGSGALTMSLLQAVGAEGKVLSFELRPEFADIARGNIETHFGAPHPAWSITLGDLAERLPETVEPASVDRVVLDMLAPWDCVDACADALTPGGVFLAYVATVTQLSRVDEALKATGRFTQPQSSETMVRGWHLDGLAVRPDHRMVAHTGFLITARKMADGHEPLVRKQRKAKTPHSAEQVRQWTVGPRDDDSPDFGERGVSDRKLRRAARKAAENTRHSQEENHG